MLHAGQLRHPTKRATRWGSAQIVEFDVALNVEYDGVAEDSGNEDERSDVKGIT